MVFEVGLGAQVVNISGRSMRKTKGQQGTSVLYHRGSNKIDGMHSLSHLHMFYLESPNLGV